MGHGKLSRLCGQEHRAVTRDPVIDWKRRMFKKPKSLVVFLRSILIPRVSEYFLYIAGIDRSNLLKARTNKIHKQKLKIHKQNKNSDLTLQQFI